MELKAAMKYVMAGLMLTTTSSAYEMQKNIEGSQGYSYTIAMNQTETVQLMEEGLVLLVSQISDSRCPPHVVCVWAGNIRATVEVKRVASEELWGEFVLTNYLSKPEEQGILDDYTFSLLDYNKNGIVKLKVMKQIDSCDELLSGFCTMEYNPVICRSGALQVSGSNMCDGQKKKQQQACLQNSFLAVTNNLCQPVKWRP
jgi:hypothetical protein